MSARIAAAQAAKAQAEARRQAKQAEVDACDEANRSEVRTRLPESSLSPSRGRGFANESGFSVAVLH